MRLKTYCKYFQHFVKNNNVSRFFDQSSKSRLIEAADTLYSLTDYNIKNKKNVNWLIDFPKDKPLIIKKESYYIIEISLLIEGLNDRISKYNVDMNIKDYNEDNMCFRFDLKRGVSKYPEPSFHMHVGSNKIPRFPYPPLDIILLCEFIFLNFFPKETELFRKTSEWRAIVRSSQDFFLFDYYQKCNEFISKNNDTLLNNLSQCRE